MIEFTERQRQTIARALTVLAVAVVASFAALVVWGVVKALSFASSALIPVIVGFFLSLFFKPYFNWWKRTVRNPTLALVMLLASVFIPLGVLAWCAGSLAVDQFFNLMAQAPELVAKVTDWFHTTFPKLRALLDRLGVDYAEIGRFYTHYGAAAMSAGEGAMKVLNGIISSLLTLIFFVFFLTSRERKGGEVVAEMPFLKDETRDFVAEQIDGFFDILVSFFQRQTVIGIIEGVYYGIGFAMVGLPYGFLLGFALGVINIIPLFGSVVVLPIALPMAYFAAGGSGLRLVMVLIVWGVGQVLDGYFITPKIQGDKTGLGYAGVLFSFFFWSSVFGPVLGMLLAIPLSAFCVVLWHAVKARYIRPVM